MLIFFAQAGARIIISTVCSFLIVPEEERVECRDQDKKTGRAFVFGAIFSEDKSTFALESESFFVIVWCTAYP